MANVRDRLVEALDNIERVVVGKRKEVELSMVALLSGGHVLLEDVPGVGKTMMVKAIAKTLGAEFKRIQFTPDLLPSDVTGVSIYNQKTMSFEFRPGPIMANIVLADEINRTSPKTQAALLESLEEGHVTIDGETIRLKQPFFVMATQNPIEYAGTYPLPEAQLDRFLFKLKLGYPSFAEELDVLERIEKGHPIEKLETVLSLEEVIEIQQKVKDIYVDELVKNYILTIVSETRENRGIRLGVSPRGSIAIMKASQAYAFLQGRDYVIPDDIKLLAPYTFSHRILLKTDMSMAKMTSEQLIKNMLDKIPVPTAKKEAARR
ncbi:AAA family ATPase [Alkalihalobacterium chitinilyticum]|uniref:MoxR family ATPase n=1 Tax=Alkalihalobacterium chitinilyticum TaxID=2980103 RepID=A0ABT5VL88_9BACI|nr:MoxR family ATPase [Alkalihalobacterium chitinilyticum]MDE5416213.1 MoxR family ATPase [Alkalihalobacterium chitinilyticum]